MAPVPLHHRRGGSVFVRVSSLLWAGFLATACAGAGGAVDRSVASSGITPSPAVSAALVRPGGSAPQTADLASPAAAAGLFDHALVHTVAVSFTPSDYEELVATYAATGDKAWLEATVVIDGFTYERAGMRLKGNSSLRGLQRRRAGPGDDGALTAPERLPWLIRLDRHVDEQHHLGTKELVVRSNTSATALDEAVALELLQRAGLASQATTYVRFSVNGSDAVLRLVVENPDEVWLARTFEQPGALYKARSTGDFGYHGDDPKSYKNAFDQEAGKDLAGMEPLVDFLEFVNNADDEAFEAGIGARLDLESFATYLAMQDLVRNFDDIDGPGINAYLYYKPRSGVFTVVPWDHNLAFGVSLGQRAPALGGEPPNPWPGAGEAAADPRPQGERRWGLAGPDAGLRGGPGGFGGGRNVLVQRCLAIPEFQQRYERALVDLAGALYTGGVATAILDGWQTLLETQAADLLAPSTLAAEAAAIAAQLSPAAAGPSGRSAQLAPSR